MNNLKQLSVDRQVLFTFGTLCAILLIIGGLFFFSLRSIESNNQLQSRALNLLASIDSTAQDVEHMQAEVLRQLLANNIQEIERLDQSVRDLEKINGRKLAGYQEFLDTEKERQLLDRVTQTRKAYWEQTQPVLALGLTNRDAEATELIISKQAPAYDEYLKAINALADYVETSANETTRATTRFISGIRTLSDVLVGLTILIAIGTGFAIAGFARRLKEDNRLLQIEVTERKRAEETLRESEQRFSDMLRNLKLTSMMLDREARITYCNDHLLKLTGWTREEVIGRDWFDLFVPSELVERLRGVHSALLDDQPIAWHHENEILTRSGARRLIRWNNSVLRSASGEVAGTASIGEDITERNRLEAHVVQSQKMETVGKLAGGVAHEFNSILTAIIGQSELLLSDLPPRNPLCKNAIEIRKSAERAAVLTRQLLAYGRKQILQPAVLDLNCVLAGMEDTLRHLMGRGTDVRIVPTAGVKAVKADAGQIEQVIMNMAMNSADAMPNGGTFTVETGNVTLDQEYVSRVPELSAGEYVMLAITDTGSGLSAEAKARVFEPFFTTKAVGQGTGLGLSTCYGIIKQSGGHIDVYSELARGAVFKIYLPQVAQPPKIPIQRLDSADLPRGTETVLLVEDDPALREMSTTLLRRLGYTVLAAADGIEALSLKQQRGTGHIDLLFTDVVMPHMSGKELSERVRALSPHTRILFTSAYTENAIVHQGVLDKGVPLLQKPFTPSSLAHKFRQILDE